MESTLEEKLSNKLNFDIDGKADGCSMHQHIIPEIDVQELEQTIKIEKEEIDWFADIGTDMDRVILK